MKTLYDKAIGGEGHLEVRLVGNISSSAQRESYDLFIFHVTKLGSARYIVRNLTKEELRELSEGNTIRKDSNGHGLEIGCGMILGYRADSSGDFKITCLPNPVTGEIKANLAKVVGPEYPELQNGDVIFFSCSSPAVVVDNRIVFSKDGSSLALDGVLGRYPAEKVLRGSQVIYRKD